MNLRRWSGRTLTVAREAFPDPIDLVYVDLPTQRGNHAGDPRYKRQMGRNSRVKVRRFLVDAGLATWDPSHRMLKAEPPPAGTPRQAWIANAYRDVALHRPPRDTMSRPVSDEVCPRCGSSNITAKAAPHWTTGLRCRDCDDRWIGLYRRTKPCLLTDAGPTPTRSGTEASDS